MFKRLFVSMTLSVFCSLLLIGCGGSDTANSSNQTGANQTAGGGGGGDKVGVPECDDFIAKYEACISSNVPAEARAQFNASVKQWRDSWRQAASTPQGKAGLVQGCKMIAEQSKQAMTPYGCSF